MNRIIGKAVLLALVAAGTTSMAFGQTTSPNVTTPAAAATQRGEHRGFRHESPTARVEARLARMQGRLAITAAQQPQWDAYAGFLRKSAQEREQSRTTRPSRDQRGTAIERLERTQAMQAKSANRLTELLAVEKPLYAVLSPDQRKVADRMLNRSFRNHGHRMAFRSGRDHESSRRG